MAGKIKGICKYCGKEFAKGGMQRHLRSCRVRQSVLEKERPETGYFGIAVQGKYDSYYWMIIEMPDTAHLNDLDQFLRDIWCECCGHLSAFDIGGMSYERYPEEPGVWGVPAKSSQIALKKVLTTGLSFSYEYDFGTTTDIELQVLWHRIGEKAKDKVTILSRNNPHHEMCGCCGRREAVWFDREYLYGGGNPFYCEACSKEEDIDAEMLLPVCNSPRMGECGYCGSEKYPDQFAADPPGDERSLAREKAKKKSSVQSSERLAGKSSAYTEPRLSPDDSKLFYQLWFPLLDFVNEKGKVNAEIGTMTGADALEVSDVKQVADYMWEHTELIDEYLQEYTELPDDHRQILRSWKKRRTGRFVLERHLKKGSIFIGAEDEQVYRCVGIISAWEEMFPFQAPPILLQTTLIPFRDVIISDGLMMTYPAMFGGNMKRMFKNAYMDAKTAGKIITTL